MISYKSPSLFDERFARNPNRNGEDPWGLDDHGGGLIGGRFDIAGYLDLQGRRFIERFDANAYLAILRTMDTWDPLHGTGRPRKCSDGSRPGSALSASVRTGFSHRKRSASLLIPFARPGVAADYREMTSAHGHDAFLAEQAELVRLLQ